MDVNAPTLEPKGLFPSTQWSVVLHAVEAPESGGQAALENLCRAYWYPLYAYVRRLGHGPEDAEDLTQAFFARLLEKDYLRHADPERGLFRTFLLTSLKRFLINEWEKGRTERRGGGRTVISWDQDETEIRFRAEPADESTPEKIFEKRWAVTLLERVLDRLEQEFAAEGKAEQFKRLKLLLWGDKGSPPHAEIAAQLHLSEGALNVAVHRLRERYRRLLRAEVACTVAGPGEVDEELRHLISVISA
jgi:RNA polymerase sigma-70 factor (ECF subfamily)